MMIFGTSLGRPFPKSFPLAGGFFASAFGSFTLTFFLLGLDIPRNLSAVGELLVLSGPAYGRRRGLAELGSFPVVAFSHNCIFPVGRPGRMQ